MRCPSSRPPPSPAATWRANVRPLASARHAVGVVLGTARRWIDALEDVLLDVGRRRDERDFVLGALQPVEIAVARRMDEAFDGAAVLREVEDHRRVGFVPIPRVVPVVLEVRRQLSGVGIDRDRGGREEVVTRALVAEPRRGVAGAPIGQVQRRIVGAGDPHGPTALLPGVAGPRLATLLSGGGNRVRLPRGLATVCIEGGDEAADAKLAARDTDHNLALGHEWGERHVVPSLPVLDLLLPHDLAGSGIQRHEHTVVGGEVDLVTVEGDPAAGVVKDAQALGHFPLVSPQQLPRLRLHRDDLVVRCRHEHHAVVDEERSLVTRVHTGGERPGRCQLPHVVNVDLIERTVRPALVVATGHQPVGRFRLGEPLVGDRAIAHDPLGVPHHRHQRDREHRNDNYEVSDSPHRGSSSCEQLARCAALPDHFLYLVSRPTRPVNPPAATTSPSTAWSGSMARRRGAGPSTTRPRSAGSNRDAWHEQNRVFDALCHIEMGQPSCVQTAEYATTPPAAWTRVSSVSWVGSSRTSATWLSKDPSRTTFVTGSIGKASCWGPPGAKSAGTITCPARSP